MSTVSESIPGSSSLPTYAALSTAAWIAAIALYAVGDTGTSVLSMQLGGIETSPIPLWFYEQLGYVGLVVNKLLVVGVCWLVWRYYPSIGGVGPDPYRLFIPLIMTGRGAWLVHNNASVITALV